MIRRPIISEKSMKLAEKGFYTFEVDKKDAKEVIAKLVEKRFSVNVLSVKTLIIKGATKVQKRVRKFFKTPDVKKAIVQLKKGQKIPLFETAKKEEIKVTTAEKPTVVKEKRGIFGGPKIKVEKGAEVQREVTQRKVITGK